MGRLLGLLKGSGFRRGVLGGSREWLVVWVLAGVVSRARKKARQPPALLHSVVLDKGEAVRISVVDP